MYTTTTAPAASSASPRPEEANKRKPRTRQVSANSPRTPITVDTRPPLRALRLPGPRREREGRGGATADINVLRWLIRCPLVTAWARQIPARSTGRRPAVPDLFWVFYLIAIREVASAEQLDATLSANWATIREEFWFEHHILLPDAKVPDSEVPDSEVPDSEVPDYDDFNKWRKKNILTVARRLEQLRDSLTVVSLPLALAIRRAEAGDEPFEPLNPGIWHCIAADGSVFNAPSDVRLIRAVDEHGVVTGSYVENSRAKHSSRARVHHEVTDTSSKRHGSPEGLFNVVAVTKGLASYTRVVLGVEISEPQEAEKWPAMRMLHQVYRSVGDAFPVLLYDGAMTPIMWQELMAEHGVYCVNSNHARSYGPRGEVKLAADGPRTPIGLGRRRYGVKRGQQKKTYVTPLPSINHEADGYVHQHHLGADDGAVYELSRPVLAGGQPDKLALLRPSALERLRDATGRYYFRLTLTGGCAHAGDYQVSYDLKHTEPDADGHVPWTSAIANIRVLPDALVETFGQVYSRRNQVESFFSWLERCFYRKDRHASWTREAQLLDLIAASLLHNAEAWAHLAYRHPTIAAELAEQLKNVHTSPDTSAPDTVPACQDVSTSDDVSTSG